MRRKSGGIASLLLQPQFFQRGNEQSVHMAVSLGKAGCDLFGPAEVKHPQLWKVWDLICAYLTTDCAHTVRPKPQYLHSYTQVS